MLVLWEKLFLFCFYLHVWEKKSWPQVVVPTTRFDVGAFFLARKKKNHPKFKFLLSLNTNSKYSQLRRNNKHDSDTDKPENIK